MRVFGWIVTGLLGLALLLTLAFGATWLGIEWYGFFGPKREAVRREVFKQTKSYNEGKMQQLTKYRIEYLRADTPEERSAIASTIRIAFADYDMDQLKPELRGFLRNMMLHK